LLESTPVPVAVSLYDALIAVRRKREATFVWVDALSIDQANSEERSSQVRLMGYIYSRAMHVAIWLGPEADESASAIQLLEKAAQNLVSPQRVRAVRQYADSAALFALLKRDYWKRLWVSTWSPCKTYLFNTDLATNPGRPRSPASRTESGVLRRLCTAMGDIQTSCRNILGRHLGSSHPSRPVQLPRKNFACSARRRVTARSNAHLQKEAQ